jgi:hypothetical protein
MGNLSSTEIENIQKLLSALSMGELKSVSKRADVKVSDASGVIEKILLLESNKTSFASE